MQYDTGTARDHQASDVASGRNWFSPGGCQCGLCNTARWQFREQLRLDSGQYKPIPVTLPYPEGHYVHLSTAKTEEDYVAYTPSDEYGKRDRQVRLKFGRYLRKAFPWMPDSEIQTHCTALKAALAIAEVPVTLQFATDRDTINRIFETKMCAAGSTYESCMCGKFDGDTIRPYHVYADSPDVAVAYALDSEGNITARSVVSTKDKRWVRLYAAADRDNDTECGVLESLLSSAGYSEGELDGNRLTRLDTNNVMLPYIDNGGKGVERHSEKWWLVCEEDTGEYRAECTDGTASRVGPRCDCCDEPVNNCECSYCACCDTRSWHGCQECNMCEQCDNCICHGSCDCNRCSECHELVEPRNSRMEQCSCERCEECHELTGNCECPETEDAENTATENATTAELPEVALTPLQVRDKINRIYVYLINRHGYNKTQAEFDLLCKAYRDIHIGRNA